MLATLIANANRNPKKHSRPYRLQDFMPRANSAPRQTPEQQAAILLAATITPNGRRH